METNKHTCERCSMDATHLKQDSDGLLHYYCHHHAPNGSTKLETAGKSFKQFTPLIIIFAIIIAFTIISSALHGPLDLMYVMSHFEGAFFVIFGGFKLLNWKGFVDAYSTYDILAKRSRVYGYVYPLIELALGLAYLFSFHLLTASIVTFVVMVISTIGVAKELAKKNEIPCACLGVVFKIPMTNVTLIEDILMGVMALVMIFLLK